MLLSYIFCSEFGWWFLQFFLWPKHRKKMQRTFSDHFATPCCKRRQACCTFVSFHTTAYIYLERKINNGRKVKLIALFEISFPSQSLSLAVFSLFAKTECLDLFMLNWQYSRIETSNLHFLGQDIWHICVRVHLITD